MQTFMNRTHCFPQNTLSSNACLSSLSYRVTLTPQKNKTTEWIVEFSHNKMEFQTFLSNFLQNYSDTPQLKIHPKSILFWDWFLENNIKSALSSH